MNICIAVLTRGYSNAIDYSTLIRRNTSIAKWLTDKSIPLLFFHEGNITEEHQRHIMDKTPDLKMQFIDIKRDGKAFCCENERIPHLNIVVNSQYFGMGYRHMCHFWFCDFWHFVQPYDVVIRIDEDCIMESSLDAIIQKVCDPGSSTSARLWTGMIDNDKDFVCVGMNQFTREFMRKTTSVNPPTKYPPSGPYTNFFVIRVDLLRNHNVFMQYVHSVSESHGIYLHRWGDLPLWGEAITYILGDDILVVDPEIRYYHGTHFTHVNKEAHETYDDGTEGSS